MVIITLLSIEGEPVDVIGRCSAGDTDNIVAGQWDCLLLHLCAIGQCGDDDDDDDDDDDNGPGARPPPAQAGPLEAARATDLPPRLHEEQHQSQVRELHPHQHHRQCRQ